MFERQKSERIPTMLPTFFSRLWKQVINGGFKCVQLSNRARALPKRGRLSLWILAVVIALAGCGGGGNTGGGAGEGDDGGGNSTDTNTDTGLTSKSGKQIGIKGTGTTSQEYSYAYVDEDGNIIQDSDLPDTLSQIPASTMWDVMVSYGDDLAKIYDGGWGSGSVLVSSTKDAITQKIIQDSPTAGQPNAMAAANAVVNAAQAAGGYRHP